MLGYDVDHASSPECFPFQGFVPEYNYTTTGCKTIERAEVQVFSRVLIYALIFVVSACEMSSRDYGQLIDHHKWVAVESTEDPFPSHRPEEIVCPDYAYKVEGEGDAELFEVETDLCNYVTLVQNSIRSGQAGDEIEIVLWHLNLIAAEAAEAHVALQLGSELLWEQNIAIPGPEAMYTPVVSLAKDWPAGTPVYLHLHNHGANSWRFLTLALAQNPAK